MPTSRTPAQKRYRERANRARRNLLHQQEEFGTVRDGSGIRYLVVPWYVLAGEPAKAAEFGFWCDLAWDDDIGEPVFWLFRALAHHRLGQPDVARWFLLQAMVSNLYLLPRVLGDPLPRQPIWHWSNDAEPDWFEGNGEFLEAPPIRSAPGSVMSGKVSRAFGCVRATSIASADSRNSASPMHAVRCWLNGRRCSMRCWGSGRATSMGTGGGCWRCAAPSTSSSALRGPLRSTVLRRPVARVSMRQSGRSEP